MTQRWSRIRSASRLALVLLLSGCAPVMRSATFAEGGTSASQWVFIDTDDEDLDGVYHCSTDGGRAECQKARLSR